jgi:tRNA(Ile2) C34 agmatinyltransferase TiaS
LRYDVTNGITLCQTCHENIHGARIPRVTKRFLPLCSECGRQTKGKAQRCKSCAMRLSPKAIAARAALARDARGHYTR